METIALVYVLMTATWGGGSSIPGVEFKYSPPMTLVACEHAKEFALTSIDSYFKNKTKAECINIKETK